MKIALVDCKKDGPNSKKRNSVNSRNMIVLEKELGADFIYNNSLMNVNKKYDVFLFGFGAFSNDIDKTVELLNNNPKAKVFWMVGEYEQTNYWAILKAKRRFNVIKNFEGHGKVAKKDTVDNWYDVNLNLLIAKNPNKIIKKKYDCIYFSRWRQDRIKYCKEYLDKNIHFSTDTKNMKKFDHAGCKAKWLKKLSWENKKETLNLFRYSLYLEDEYTHKVFNNLGNRWYEAGFCNNVVLFDSNCINTIKKSEIGKYYKEIEYYIVSNKKELHLKIEEMNKDFMFHLNTQKKWRKNEMKDRKKVIEKIKSILTNT